MNTKDIVRRLGVIGRLCLRLARQYFGWAMARGTWWSKALALGVPVLASLFLVSAITGGAESTRETPQSLPVGAQIEAPMRSASATPSSQLSDPDIAPPPPQQEPTLSPTAVPVPTVLAFADGALTPESVKAALSSSKLISTSFILGQPDLIDVTDGQVLLTYDWNYSDKITDYVANGGYAAYNAARVLFEHPQVNRVGVQIKSHFVDRFGNTISEPSTIIVMNRSTAGQVNWDGLGILVLKASTNMFCASDGWFIHPLVYAKVPDKGCLLNAAATRISP